MDNLDQNPAPRQCQSAMNALKVRHSALFSAHGNVISGEINDMTIHRQHLGEITFLFRGIVWLNDMMEDDVSIIEVSF